MKKILLGILSLFSVFGAVRAAGPDAPALRESVPFTVREGLPATAAKLDAGEPVTTACIRCGRCAAHCPLNLQPAAFETAYRNNEPETLKALKVNLCMECGCCAYVCPAKRPLVQVNKLSKAMLNQHNAQQKAQAEAKEKKEASVNG